MLKIPSFRRIGELTVYQDDTIWYRFYLQPSQPSVRIGSNGLPVFLMALYHFSDQARAEDEQLPRGGGYMNFDVQYKVTEDEAEAAKQELQAWVNEEYARRKADPEYAGDPDYAGANAPSVELADPQLSGGTVRMLTTQSEHLVSATFAEAPASLVAGSTAVFNADLTDNGASFMRQLLVDDAGAGAIDLTPIQVIYDLTMWARLPPVVITITAESERVHEELQKISETNRDNPCTPREVESYRENGVNSSTLNETGLVNIHVDKGDASVPDEVVDTLQQYALDLFDTMIQERFLVPAEADGDELRFDADDPAIQEADPGWAAMLYERPNFKGKSVEVREDMDRVSGLNNKVGSVRVRPGHRITLYDHYNFGGSSKQLTGSARNLGGRWSNKTSSVKTWRPPTARYKVRKTVNHSTMNLEIRLDRSQVVEWPAGGQATLETFFAGMSPSEIQQHVVEVFADDFNTLGVEVRALVDFENGPVQAVEVQLEYEARDDSGEKHVSADAYTFTAAETGMRQFDPTIINGQQEYRSRYRVIYDNGAETDYTPWEVSSNRALNVAVANPDRLDLEVSAATLNWDVVRGVVLNLSYSDATQTLDKSFELSADRPLARWTQQVAGALTGDIEARIRYLLVDQKVVEGEPLRLPVSDNLLVVPQPQVDVLNVSMLPSGDWSEVAQAVVALQYDNGDGRVFDKTFRFQTADQFAEWAVLLQDPDRRAFRYQIHMTFNDGSSDSGEWVDADGDQTILIKAQGAPKSKLVLNPALVDFTHTPAVLVNVEYGGEQRTLTFTDKTPQTVEFARSDDADQAFRYDITWHPTDGDPIQSGWQRNTATQLLIPKAKAAVGGGLQITVRGFAVDWAATPFVDVVLSWGEGDQLQSGNLTLSQNEPNAMWTIDTPDRSQRRYRYQITYNLADGTRQAGATGESEDPVISITPLAT